MQTLLTLPTKNRNKIEIQTIYPAIPKSEFTIIHTHSILGISINSPSATGNKIKAIFDFLIKRGSKGINIFIADSLYRYTAMIKHHCNEEEGRFIGNEKRKQFTDLYSNLLNNESKPYPLHFLYSSNMEGDPQFQQLFKNIWEIFENFAPFRNSVIHFSDYYLSRVCNVNMSPELDYSQFAYKYVIEELVILALLNQQGFKTLLYPGAMKDIYNMINLNHAYFSKLFKDYTFVSLRIKRK